MSAINERLAELGLEIPQIAAPLASYVPAVTVGNLVFTAGQLPFVDGKLYETGKVGTGSSSVSPERAKECSAIAILNALAAVESQILSLDRVKRIVKLTGFVASDPDFTGQPGVINGASDLLVDIFGEKGQHARSAVGVSVLPIDSPVEIELIVEFE